MAARILILVLLCLASSVLSSEESGGLLGDLLAVQEQDQDQGQDLEHDSGVYVCDDGLACVKSERCSKPVGRCSDLNVCCALEDTEQIATANVTEQSIVDSPVNSTLSDDVDMRSVSGSNHRDENSKEFRDQDFSPLDEQGELLDVDSRSVYGNRQQSYDPYSNYNDYEGSNYQSGGYGGHVKHTGSYGGRGHGGSYSDVAHGQHGAGYGYPAYPVHEPYDGRFHHAYRGDYGVFAPDFYGPQYDVRSLSGNARDALHRYRYKSQCGVKPVGVFPSLPPYGEPPYAAPYGTPYGDSYGPHPAPYQEPRHQKSGKVAQHPWQAAVLSWTHEGYELKCSATIVHPYLLITSAHCLRGIVEPELKILLGVSDLLNRQPSLPPIERRVARVFVHEQYDADTLAHDVALLQLASSINFHFTPHIAPACLPENNRTFVASNCYIVGWTHSHFEDPLPSTNEIAVSDMKFIKSKQECENKLSNERDLSDFARGAGPSQLTKEMHCITGETSTSCLTPSGGALFCDVPVTATCQGHGCPNGKTFLAGLVSWSNSRCGAGGLAVITELSPYVEWINELLEQAGGFDHFNPEYFGNFGPSYLPHGDNYGAHDEYGQGHSSHHGYGGSHSGGYPVHGYQKQRGYGSSSHGGYPSKSYGYNSYSEY